MDVGQKISICAPCHNRTHDLKIVLPSWIKAANASPPVEIVILDYNSPDDLQEYFLKCCWGIPVEGNSIRLVRYAGRNYYHMAHARNLSVLAAKGDYIVTLGADSIVLPDYIEKVRSILRPGMWVTVHGSECIFAMYKQDFIDAGGYDERFEFYGPEDRDLNRRLERRGLSCVTLPREYMSAIHTNDADKIANYRMKLSKREMSTLMQPIYYENIENKVMVANENKAWGQW
jgi:glycosyltransferase involved in cell wall biosynthesis